MAKSRKLLSLDIFYLLAAGNLCIGCAGMDLLSTQQTATVEPNHPTISFDDMLLTAIRRNVINVKSTMSPDEVVTTLGLQTFGQI